MEALKMEADMDSWNDERLDELNRRVADGFKATRNDLTLVKSELEGNIAQLRTELKGDIAQLRTELKGDIAQLETELKGDIAGVKDDLKGVKEAVAGCATKEELVTFKGELKAEMGEVKGALRDLNKRFDRVLLALMGAGLTFGITVLGVVGGVIVKLT